MNDFRRNRGKVIVNDFRLPTEAEWEGAARCSGDLLYAGSNTEGDVAWYRSNSGSQTQPVGGKSANGCGLFDMSGNVWEWTNGWYSQADRWRVVRGGSYFNSANMARVDSRYGQFLHEQFHLDLIGFRCCKSAVAEK